MKKELKSGLIVLIVIILIIIGLSIFSVNRPVSYFNFSVFSNSANSSPSTSQMVTNKSKDSKKSYGKKFIAALKIKGTIQEANSSYNQAWLISTIKSLKDNKNNVALAVFIDSPGGAVYQADEAYLALEDYKTSGKPVYVYQGSMAASGGYYISCAANQIYANRNTLTGCIGVLMGTSFDLTGLFDKVGIKSETIHSGKNKNMLNYNEPITDEQRAIMQSLCDDCYKQFVNIVAKSRHMPTPKAIALSDGRLYTANQALENGLVDHIDSWENMIKDLSEKELNMPGIKVNTYQYYKKQTFVDMMMGKAHAISNANAAASLGLPETVIEDMNNFSMTPMYLCK